MIAHPSKADDVQAIGDGQPVVEPKIKTEVELETEEKLFSRFAEVKANADFYFSGISSKDRTTLSTAKYLSQTNIGLNFHWFENRWEKMKTLVGLRVRFENYQSDSDNAQSSIQGSKQVLFTYSIGLQHSPTPRLQISESLQLSQELFDVVEESSSSGVTLSAALVSKLCLAANYQIFTFQKNTVFSELQIVGIGPGIASGFSTKPGLGYGMELGLDHNFRLRSKISSKIYYHYQRASSSFVLASRQDLGVKIGYQESFE